MANFCSIWPRVRGSRDRSKIWPRPIFPKFTGYLDIDPLNWFGTVETYEINFRPKKSDLTRGSTWLTNTLNAKSEDHAPIMVLPDGQSSWNLVGSLLASILNEWHPYWVNLNKFWKWLIFALSGLGVRGSRDRSKIWPRPIFCKFSGDLDIDSLNWFGTVKTYEINFRPKKIRSDTWFHLTHKYIERKIWGPRPN